VERLFPKRKHRKTSYRRLNGYIVSDAYDIFTTNSCSDTVTFADKLN